MNKIASGNRTSVDPESSRMRMDNLATLSCKALNDYDELLEKYNRLGEELTKAQRLNIEQNEKIQRLQEVLVPVYDEYDGMKNKYSSERHLRLAAESYASKVVKDNKKIKRQSAMLIQHMQMKAVEIDIDGLDQPDTCPDEDNHLQELNKALAELQEDLSSVKLQLRKTTEENATLNHQVAVVLAENAALLTQLETSKEELKRLQLLYEQQMRELTSLKRVSTLAYTDFQELVERCEVEKTLRIKAEAYAMEMQQKRRSTEQRNSLNLGSHDDWVKSLMEENEKLLSEIATLETNYRNRVSELEQELVSSRDPESLNNMKEKIGALGDELERVSLELQLAKDRSKQLEETISKLEREKRDFMHIPLPPPPPPPPGPPGGILKSLTDMLKTGKQRKAEKIEKVVGSGAKGSEAMQKALEEMMERIKHGRGLRPVEIDGRPGDLKPAKEGEAMEQMHNILMSMKKKRVIEVKQQQAGTAEEGSELARKLTSRLNRIAEAT